MDKRHYTFKQNWYINKNTAASADYAVYAVSATHSISTA